MDRFSQRESVLLGYSPQRIFTNNHPISSPGSPDVDFNDVFGGPPRRASIQETGFSFGENDMDSYAFTSTSNHRHRWSRLSEKPVFGDEIASRRRYPSHDFFDDIFKGGESLSSSPKKSERDLFSSNSDPRILSPGRPLPPRAVEPFASSSVPAQFSLPAKLIKGTDLPTFGSSARNHHKNKDTTANGISFYAHSPLSRFASQADQVQEDVSFQSSLSQELSADSIESSTVAKSDEMDKGSKLKKDSNPPEVSNSSSHFHFSIYKWASKGVPLALPLRGGKNAKSKERTKLDRSSSASGRVTYEAIAKELPAVTTQDINRPSFSNSISSDAKSSEIELDKRENNSPFVTSTVRNGKVEQWETVEKAVLTEPEPENQRTHQETVEDGPGNLIFDHSKEEGKAHPVIGTVKSGKTEKQIPVAAQETPITELKTLLSLISGTESIKNESKESKVKNTKKSAAVFNVSENVKREDGERSRLNVKERDKADLKISAVNSQDHLAKNRARGKVKEFVKIFNQEASNKPTLNMDSHSRSSKWNKAGKVNSKDDPSVTTTQAEEKVHFPNGNKNQKPDNCNRVDEFLKHFEKEYSETRTDNHKPADMSSQLKDGPASTAASTSDASEPIVGDPDDSFQGNILIKELSQDQVELQQAGDNKEDFQAIDTKIRKWSYGKEGNIRSLLSTLQYVLWPESGWKPVPLVDIIEGNAVKRSYQKALLCLHPDKLQQKGAAPYQKYTAEKIFDILQELGIRSEMSGLENDSNEELSE